MGGCRCRLEVWVLATRRQDDRTQLAETNDNYNMDCACRNPLSLNRGTLCIGISEQLFVFYILFL